MRVTTLASVITAALACASGDAAQDTAGFEIRTISLGTSTAGVRVIDLDGDGRAEVLAPGPGRLTVLARLGSDGGPPLVVREAADAGDNPVAVAAGDLDGDGRTDLAIANHDTHYITVLLAGPDGFGPARHIDVDVSPHPHAVALADLDEDGRPELLVDDRNAEALRVLRADGAGGFEAVGRIDVGGDPYRGMVIADVDDDEHLDIVTPNPDRVAIQLGDGTGAFSPGPTLQPRGFRPFAIAVGDFDGDGVADIAAGSGEGPAGAEIWLGDGGGRFRPAPGSPFTIAAGPTAAAAADIDGDGVDDLLLSSWSGELAIVYGRRAADDTGEALQVVRIPLPGSPWGVDAGDIDGDGDVEVVVSQGDGDGVLVLVR
jgi:hypothetical protein